MSVELAQDSCSLPVWNNTCFPLSDGSSNQWYVTSQPVWTAAAGDNPYTTIKAAGIQQIICIRDASEIDTQPNPFDLTESEQVVLNNMAYTNTPLAHITTMTQAQFNIQAYNAATAIDYATKPVLVHCSTGDRASAAFAVYLISYYGFSNQMALDFATQRLALANAQFIQFVQNYRKP